MRHATLPLACALLATSLALPAASAESPLSGAFYTAAAMLVGTLAGVDALASNAIGHNDTGAYPGQPTVQTAVAAFRGDGAIGGPGNEVGRALDDAWGEAYPRALETLNRTDEAGGALVAPVVEAALAVEALAYGLGCAALADAGVPQRDLLPPCSP